MGLLILIIVSCIPIGMLITSFVKDDDELGKASLILCVLVGFIGWVMIGTLYNTKTEKIPIPFSEVKWNKIQDGKVYVSHKDYHTSKNDIRWYNNIDDVKVFWYENHYHIVGPPDSTIRFSTDVKVLDSIKTGS